MGKRHTNQEWQTLIEQSESSSLSTLAFCKLNELNPSTFYAKRQQLKKADVSQGFVRAEIVEKTTKYQAQIATANMTLLINDVELSIPQGTPAAYLAELIGALISYIQAISLNGYPFRYSRNQSIFPSPQSLISVHLF